MGLRLPPTERVLLRQPPLALALAQVRFPVLPRFPDGAYVDGLYQALRADYPKGERTVQFSLPFAPDQAAGHVPGSTLWRFSTADERWSVVLAENALTLEVRGYSSIDEFSHRFSVAVERLVAAFDPALQTRLGLRYVNEFRRPGADTLAEWRTLIRPEVLGLAGIAQQLLDGTEVTVTRQEMEVGLPDGSLVIRHGLLTGTTVEPRAQDPPSGGAFYLLDMDRSDPTPREIDPIVIAERLRDYNDLMYRFFRWAMLDPLYAALEPDHAG